jgi:hypothetical protein
MIVECTVFGAKHVYHVLPPLQLAYLPLFPLLQHLRGRLRAVLLEPHRQPLLLLPALLCVLFLRLPPLLFVEERPPQPTRIGMGAC